MKEIVVIGAGDFGKEVAWLIEDINKKAPMYIILGFLDDDTDKIGKQLNGYECLGPVSSLIELNKNHHACAVVAMQDSDIRRQIVKMFPELGDINPSNGQYFCFFKDWKRMHCMRQ